MPKPSQILAVGAVAAGGAYYYDANVHPIWSQRQVPPVTQQERINNNLNYEAQKADAKARNLGNKLSNRFEQHKDEAAKHADSTFDSIKNSSFVNKLTNKTDEAEDRFKSASNQYLSDPAKKSLPHRLADKYIDVVNSFGETTTGKSHELANSTSAKTQDLKQSAANERDSWFNWFGAKKDHAQHDANQKIDHATHHIEKSKDGWFDWGSTKQDEATAKARHAENVASEKKNEWLNWGGDKKDEAANEAANKKKEWLNWSGDKKDEAADKAADKKNEWLNWGSAKSDEAANEAANKAGELKDWNKQKVQEADEARLKYQQEAKHQFDQHSKAAQETFDNEKQRAIDQYNRAKHNLDDLTSKLSSKTSSLFSSNEPTEKQRANEHLSQARKDFEDSLGNLKKYGSDLIQHIDQQHYTPLKKEVHNLDK